MKFHFSALLRAAALLAAVAATALVSPVLASEPAGMLLAVEGPVHFEAERPARRMGVVLPGQALITGAEGRAELVLFADGRRLRLQPHTHAIVSAGGVEVSAGPPAEELEPLDAVVYSNLKRTVSSGTAGPGGGVVLRSLAAGTSELPVSSRLFRTTRPELRWQPLPGAQRYEVEVQDPVGEPLWQTSTSETRAAHPETAPELQPGQRYRWQVTAFDASGQLDRREAPLQVLPAAEAADLAEALRRLDELAADGAELPAALARVGALRAHGLSQDAADELERLLERHPAEPELGQMLAALYDELGWREAAASTRLRSAGAMP
jgi:hypothetical protein